MGKILRPDASRVMDGLRDTGYTFYTAVADVVDNSIAANATKIAIVLQKNSENKLNLYIADNGYGMDSDGIENAMTYGSRRRDSVHSLGKFGLGLKTASTAFCRSLSVLAKTATSDYTKATWDLDHVAEVGDWELLDGEILDDEIDFLEDVTEGGAGTLVIWDKIDRLLNKDYKNFNTAFTRLLSKLSFHLSMVFQRYIDNSYEGVRNVEISLNGEILKPWDPFCLHELRKDDSGEIDKNGTILVGKTLYDLKDELSGETISSCLVNAWILPRKEYFSSSDSYAAAEIKNSMEGFYVYRENRLIHYGDWLGIHIPDPHFSLLRVDLSFDASFDDFFKVDIKKSTVSLNEELSKILEDFLKSPRRVAENRYRKAQIEKSKKSSIETHAPSNTTIDTVVPSLPGQTPTVAPIPGSDDVQVTPTDGKPTFTTGTIKIVANTDIGQSRVIPVATIDGGFLWEPSVTNDGKHAVSINMGHSYYQKIYAQNKDNPNLIIGMDSLLWALAEAEMRICNDATKETFEELRNEVSRCLKKLISSLPDE
jgi:hypothetical protein